MIAILVGVGIIIWAGLVMKDTNKKLREPIGKKGNEHDWR